MNVCICMSTETYPNRHMHFISYLLTQCSLLFIYIYIFVLYHLGQFYMTACVKPTVECDVNVLDEYGRTCLHAAASGG